LSHPLDVSALAICASRASQSATARDVARMRGDEARRCGMTGVIEATLDRWFTPTFRASGQAEAVAAQLLANDVEAWAQA